MGWLIYRSTLWSIVGRQPCLEISVRTLTVDFNAELRNIANESGDNEEDLSDTGIYQNNFLALLCAWKMVEVLVSVADDGVYRVNLNWCGELKWLSSIAHHDIQQSVVIKVIFLGI